jgi:hypothetical protein
VIQTRRRLLTTLSLAVAGGLIGPSQASGAEGALETTTLRLTRTPPLCVAPLYVVEELLARRVSAISAMSLAAAMDPQRSGLVRQSFITAIKTMEPLERARHGIAAFGAP